MLKVIIATRNSHKVAEIQAVLGSRFSCHALSQFPGAPQVSEDATTFVGNALKKAQEIAGWLAQQSGPLPDFVLADDSGLEVDALNGAPGIHSARFAALDSGAAGNSTDAENNAKLLRLLQGVSAERRTARFRCALALVPITPAAGRIARTFEGTCEGRIDTTPRGAGGFGYDPLFIPNGFEVSFAELGATVKDRISHRTRALEQLQASGAVA